MPQDWNDDDETGDPGSPGGAVPERLPRAFTFDTGDDEIDHLIVQRRTNQSWEDIGELHPDVTTSEFYDWLVDNRYDPPAKGQTLQLRIYPADTENACLVQMTGRGENGPKVLKIPYDNAELRAARARVASGEADPGAAVAKPAAPAAPDPMTMMVTLLQKQLDAQAAEMREMRRLRAEEDAARALQQRNMTADAVRIQETITAEGIGTLKDAFGSVLAQGKGQQDATISTLQALNLQAQQAAAAAAQQQQAFMQMQIQAMQQQNQAHLAMIQAQTERERIAAQERADRDREREDRRREEEAAREERRRQDDDARAEREEQRRQEYAIERERLRDDALRRQEEAMAAERERQREHLALQIATLKEKTEATTSDATLFGGVGKILTGLGIDPAEKLRAILSGDSEEAQESITEILSAVTPVAQTALQGMFGWLQSRNAPPVAEPPPPPPPPRTLPDPTPLPATAPPLADITRALGTSPPPAQPLPVQSPPEVQPVAPPAGADTSPPADDPLNLNDMRAARDGMTALIDAVTSHPEAEWDDLIRATLEASPPTVALLRAWGVARCVADMSGPMAKVAALREHLAALGVATP